MTKSKNVHLAGTQLGNKDRKDLDGFTIDISDEEFLTEFDDDCNAFVIDEEDISDKYSEYRQAMWPCVGAHSLMTDPASFYVNNVVFSGIICTNPKWRVLHIEDTSRGMCEFNVAQKVKYFSRVENVYFNRYTTIGVRTFGETALMIRKLRFRGDFIQIIGQLSTRYWDKLQPDGTKIRQSKTIILANQVQMWQPHIKKFGNTTDLTMSSKGDV